jgi:hypothetical protein
MATRLWANGDPIANRAQRNQSDGGSGAAARRLGFLKLQTPDAGPQGDAGALTSRILDVPMVYLLNGTSIQ